jgi:hypothetical protein
VRRERRFDPGAMTAGLVLGTIGAWSLAAGTDGVLADIEWLWPIVLLAVGVSLLLGPRASARQHRARDQVGAERGEYR